MPNGFPYYSGFLDDKYPSDGITRTYDNEPQGGEWKVTTEPTVEAAMLAETKTFLSVNNDVHDDLITGFILSATKDIESYCGVSIAEQTITAYWRNVVDYVILPQQPILTISSVKSIEPDGTETTLTSSDYYIYGQDEKILSFQSSVLNQLQVIYTAGYSDAYSTLPQNMKDAVKWQTKLYYNNRSTGQDDFVAIDEASGLVVQALTAVKKYRTWT